MDKIDINDVLKEMEDYLETASRVPLMSKVLVDGDYLLELIDKIHAIMPEEMKQAKQVLEQSDKLLESIESQGKKMLEDAKLQAGRMITETEIVQHAKAEAERILQQASEQANALVAQANEGALETTNAAKNYVDSILYQVEVNLDKITSSVKKTRDDWQKSNDEAK
ncbi:MAG: hypothetical protein PHN47_00200 [Clostridia bacterium]|jgi:cell division septum initiation protein DivIVA|nr:hypothetical protein [Clostridia bacterium]